jgi:hypothetical protein
VGGDNVGTYQEDALQEHTHEYEALRAGTGISGGTELGATGIATLGVNPPAKQSSETRARNIYVMLIIKT